MIGSRSRRCTHAKQPITIAIPGSHHHSAVAKPLAGAAAHLMKLYAPYYQELQLRIRVIKAR